MGNCLKHPSSTDEEADEGAFSASSTKAKATTEVKIKITKKQLEEMLKKMDVRELRVEEVLSHLMNHSGDYQSLQRPWRPALQSIPELN
ncbi:hypothetical protein RJT34_00464 [Clitoria ternatea]|uniref:Uncharacterized protein n=1 Tax=Clitoria ternatea TaxID=43366 RepID=A0AAN9PY20_CLITE